MTERPFARDNTSASQPSASPETNGQQVETIPVRPRP